MLTFAYQARDTSGKTISGIQDALNEDNAINTLMARGLMVLSIQQKSAAQAATKRFGRSATQTSFCSPASSRPWSTPDFRWFRRSRRLYEQCDPKKQAASSM